MRIILQTSNNTTLRNKLYIFWHSKALYDEYSPCIDKRRKRKYEIKRCVPLPTQSKTVETCFFNNLKIKKKI